MKIFLSINQALTLQTPLLCFTNSVYPEKKVLIRPNDRPWFTSELRHNIRIRDRLRQKAFLSKSEQDKLNYKKNNGIV